MNELIDAAAIVAAIRPGDRVWIRTPHGQVLAGRAVICSGTHAALDLGGKYGRPGVVTPENLVRVRKARVAGLGLVLAAVALAGCAATNWQKQDASPSDFEVDRGQCAAQAYSAGAGAAPRQLIYNACMRGKGWHRV